MEDIKIHNGQTKARILQAKAQLMQAELSLLVKEYIAANESQAPLDFLLSAEAVCVDLINDLENAAEILWD